MKTKILGIQFRRNPVSAQQERQSLRREISPELEIDFISAIDEFHSWTMPKVLLQGYRGLILGGSGDFDFDGNRTLEDPARMMSQVFLLRLKPLFEYIFYVDLPTIGICYGHQLLGAHNGVSVVYDSNQQKTCSHKVSIMADVSHPFLADIPNQFYAHYGHKDVLSAVPSSATLVISGGPECLISALYYQNNIFSTQFHPELLCVDMKERARNSPGYLPSGVSAEEVFFDDPHSNVLLKNFSRLVMMNA